MTRLATWLILGSLALAGQARAVDAQITSETIGQGYQLITATGEVLKRSRIHEMLGANVYDILGDGTNSLFVVSQFRFATDFGFSDTETTNIPTIKNNNFSVLYLYVEARNLAGFLDIRAGRQLIVDDADYTMFDGGLFTFHTPVFLAFDAYSGVEVKNGGALEAISDTQLELDGAAEDASTGIVIGASVYTEGLRAHSARIGWRRIMTTSQSSPLGGSENFVDMEKVFANYYVRALPNLHLGASAAFDLVNMTISDAKAEIRVPELGHKVDLELSYWFLTPTFEGSSVFNIFQTAPLNDIDFRVRYHITDDASAYLGGYTRLFRQYPDSNDTTSEDLITDWGLRGGGKVGLGKTGRIGIDANYQTGYGDITTIDLFGGYGFLDDTLDLNGHLTTVLFDDDSRDKLNGKSFGVQVAVSYKIKEMAKFHLINEFNTNAIERVQYRVYGMVDLSFWL